MLFRGSLLLLKVPRCTLNLGGCRRSAGIKPPLGAFQHASNLVLTIELYPEFPVWTPLAPFSPDNRLSSVDLQNFAEAALWGRKVGVVLRRFYGRKKLCISTTVVGKWNEAASIWGVSVCNWSVLLSGCRTRGMSDKAPA